MAFPSDGEDGLAAGGIPSGLRGSGFAPGIAPELAGCSDASLEAGGRNRLLWVLQRLPEVGGGLCCSSGRVGPPVGSWVSGEGVWRLELGSGGLRRELADEVNFGQKWG